MGDMANNAALVGCEARLILGGEWLDCWLAELTPRGAVLEIDRPLPIGEKVVACIGEVGAMPGVVSEVGGGLCEIAFRTTGPDIRARMSSCYARG